MNKTGKKLQSDSEITLEIEENSEKFSEKFDETTETVTEEIFTFVPLVTTSKIEAKKTKNEEGKWENSSQNDENSMSKPEKFETSTSSSKFEKNTENSQENLEKSGKNDVKSQENHKNSKEIVDKLEETSKKSEESSKKSDESLKQSGESSKKSEETSNKSKENSKNLDRKVTEPSNIENQSPISLFLVTTSNNFVHSTEEIFTFHPITTSSASNKVSVLTFINFPTTEIDQNSFSSSQSTFATSLTSPSTIFDESSTVSTISPSTPIFSTPAISISKIPSISTDFFSENPKNILQPTTENFGSTSNFPSLEGDLIDPTEPPVDSREVEDEMKDFNHRKGTTNHIKDKDDEEKLQNEVENETENFVDATTVQDDLGLMFEGGREDNDSVKVENSEKENEKNSSISTLENPSRYPEIFTKPSEIENNFNTTTKPKQLLYYYFITAIKSNESSSKETENSTNVSGDQSMFMGIPGELSCDLHQN